MSHNWATKRLEDIAERVCVGFVGSCNSAYVAADKGIPMIRTTNITKSGLSFENLKYVTKEFHEKNKKSQLKKGDLLIARHGDSGLPSIYMSSKEANCLNAVMVKLYPNEQFADNLFLMYSFKNSYIRHQIKATVSGSVQGVVNTKTIAQLNIPYPDRDIRIKIVNILSALDDKIELNCKMNQTLEEMAQALFKSWFVDFDPVHAKADAKSDAEMAAVATELGIAKKVLELFPSEFVESEMGMIPLGWEVSTIGNEFAVTMGQSPAGKSYNETKNGMIFFQGRRDFGTYFPSERVYTTEPKRLAKEDDILLSVRAPVGDINIALKECCVGRGLSALKHKSNSISYSYLVIKNLRKYFDRYNTEGTVFGSVNQNTLKSLNVLKDEEVINKFNELAEPMFEQIKNNSVEILSLQRTRDTLLPKLLSGELDVSNITIKQNKEN